MGTTITHIYQLGSPLVQADNQEEYYEKLGNYFLNASTENKEKVLAIIEKKAVTSEQELDLYWNLGGYISTAFKTETQKSFIRNQLKGSYINLSKKLKFHTYSSKIFDLEKK